MGRWWKRRTKSQKTLLVAACVVALAATIAGSADREGLNGRTPEPPAAVGTTPSAVLPITTVGPTTSTTHGPGSTTETSDLQTTTTSALPTATTPVAPTVGTAAPATGTVVPTTGAAAAAGATEVAAVIDGDSIRVITSDGSREEVRLIGIDTPETGEKFAREATASLGWLVGGATVRLEFDAETRDQYGRLLAYVWVGEVMANEVLLHRGLATVYVVSPNVKYSQRFDAAQEEARAKRSGVWAGWGDTPIRIVSVRYDAPGDDGRNMNEEYVTFEVLVSGTLAGYSVEDEAGLRYRFPDRVFAKGHIFRLRSGEGRDTQTDLYWGASRAAIWNNEGDTVKVLDRRDRIVESHSY